MTPMRELPCWDIMGCGNAACVVRKHPETPCWEVVSEMGYFQSAMNICGDCLVYVSRQRDRVLTDRELFTIMQDRLSRNVKPYCPATFSGRMAEVVV